MSEKGHEERCMHKSFATSLCTLDVFFWTICTSFPFSRLLILFRARPLPASSRERQQTCSTALHVFVPHKWSLMKSRGERGGGVGEVKLKRKRREKMQNVWNGMCLFATRDFFLLSPAKATVEIRWHTHAHKNVQQCTKKKKDPNNWMSLNLLSLSQSISLHGLIYI